METNIKKWFIVGTIFTLVFGTILHFAYDWTNQSRFIGIFSPVNESVWEHLKMLFWPLFFYSIIEYVKIGYRYNNYLFSKFVSFYTGILLIIDLYFGYTGIIGKHYLVIDIIIYILSVILCQLFGYKVLVSKRQISTKIRFISLILISLLAIMFVVFTFNPPRIRLFIDPETGRYGI